MNTFLLPFLAFVTVVLFMLLLYGVWFLFLDPHAKAKKRRLQSIYDAVHPDGQSVVGSAQKNNRDSAFAIWLRSRSSTFARLEQLAHRAQSRFTAGQLIGFMIFLFMAIVLAGILRDSNLLLLLPLAAAIASTPLLWLLRMANKRRRAFDDKLPETLDYISRSLRAGHSLTSALGMVGKEMPEPTGPEFKTVFDEISFGIPFKDAISQLVDRVQSDDLNFFVISLSIQHETGGNLTELLDGLASTIRERIKLRGKIRTLTAEGRMSAMMLGIMPPVFAIIITLIRPSYISVLWSTPKGHMLLLIAGLLIAVGAITLNRMTHIKV